MIGLWEPETCRVEKEINTQNKELHLLVTLLQCVHVACSIWQHNSHWHNSPLWAKAFLRSFCHPSPFLAVLLQCLSPIFLASPVTPSSHLSLGLPFCLLPSTTAAETLLAGFCSSSRITCPAHLRRLILIYVMMSLSLYGVYNPSLYFILHSPLSFVGPKLPLKTFLSKTPSLASSDFDSTQVSEPYTSMSALVWSASYIILFYSLWIKTAV